MRSRIFTRMYRTIFSGLMNAVSGGLVHGLHGALSQFVRWDFQVEYVDGVFVVKFKDNWKELPDEMCAFPSSFLDTVLKFLDNPSKTGLVLRLKIRDAAIIEKYPGGHIMRIPTAQARHLLAILLRREQERIAKKSSPELLDNRDKALYLKRVALPQSYTEHEQQVIVAAALGVNLSNTDQHVLDMCYRDTKEKKVLAEEKVAEHAPPFEVRSVTYKTKAQVLLNSGHHPPEMASWLRHVVKGKDVDGDTLGEIDRLYIDHMLSCI